MKSVYLIGIGGAGMSGLARYFYHNGWTVSGADQSDNDTMRALETDLGIVLHRTHAPENIPVECDAVVYSPAIPPDHVERIEASRRGIGEYSYPEYLGVISQDKQTIAVAGTNGKTTTTTMIATVLDELGLDPTVIVGGNMPRFGSNFRAGESNLFVVEACEYKESFLYLHPNIVVITNITPDHLDYFGTIENYVDVFVRLIDRLPEDGTVITNPALEYIEPILKKARERGHTVVDYSQYTHHQWNLPVPGLYNICNASAALTACLQVGLETSVVQKTIETKFETADRRFQLLGMTKGGASVYDDYAHNVEALDLLREGVRKTYPDKRVVLVYQLHEFSRTEMFLDGWVSALGKFDAVYLLPIYPAREKEQDFTIRATHVVDAVAVQPHAPQIEYIDSVEVGVEALDNADYIGDTIIICAGAGVANKIGQKLVQ